MPYPTDRIAAASHQEPRSLSSPTETYPNDPLAVAAHQEPRSLLMRKEHPGGSQNVGVGHADIPSRLIGGAGIRVTTVGTAYAVDMDIAELEIAGSGDPRQQWVPVWVEGSPVETVSRVPVAAIPQDAPADGRTYGRKDHAWYDVSGGIIVDWDDITGIPLTFPPSPHTHPISDVVNLQTELDFIEAEQLAQTTAINGKQNLAPAGGPWGGQSGSWVALPAPVDAYTKAQSDARYEPIDTMYTKAESDAKYLTPATATATYEPKITAGNPAHFWAGDKTWKAVPAAGIPEAPTDGKVYGRRGQDTSWQTVVGGATISDTPPGSPVSGQFWLESDTGTLFTYWADANSSQWVDVSGSSALGNYLPLAGGTLSGDLKLDKATAGDIRMIEWTLAGKSAWRWIYNNDGNMYLSRFNATTGVFTDNPIRVNGSDGGVFVGPTGLGTSGNIQIDKASPSLVFNHSLTDADGAHIYMMRQGKQRWQVLNYGTDTGGNVGSDFILQSFADDGLSVIQNPLTITRTGRIDIYQTLRWMYAPGYAIQATATSFNICSNLALSAGMYIAPGGSAWSSFSDARLPHKIDATPVNDVLDRLDGVQLYTNMAPSGQVELFAKAQELYTSLPEVVHAGTGPDADNPDFKMGEEPQLGDPNIWGITYDRIGIVALQAVKELKAIVEAQAARIAELEAASGV